MARQQEYLGWLRRWHQGPDQARKIPRLGGNLQPFGGVRLRFCWNPSTGTCFCSASMEQVEGLLFGSWISTSFLKPLRRCRLCGLCANFAMPSPFVTCACSLGASFAAIWVTWCFWGSGVPVWHRNYDAEIRHTSHLHRENWWLIPARLCAGGDISWEAVFSLFNFSAFGTSLDPHLFQPQVIPIYCDPLL